MKLVNHSHNPQIGDKVWITVDTVLWGGEEPPQ